MKLLRKLLATLLIASLAGNSFAQSTDNLAIRCYRASDLDKIANALTDLDLCQVDLAAKDALIKKNMLTIDGLNPGAAWWQEPSFVWGGMVVSFAAGSFVTFLVLRK